MKLDDSLTLQLLRLGAFLESKEQLDTSMFADKRLRQVVEGLAREKPDVSSLARLLKDLKCVWNHPERALDAIERAMQIDADSERCKPAMREVMGLFLQTGGKQHTVERVREIMSEEFLKKYNLEGK